MASLKTKPTNWAGVILGVLMILGGLFGYYLLKQKHFSDTYFCLFIILVGGVFIQKSRQGKSTKYLLTKEDIGKFTLFPGLKFRDYLLLVASFAGALIIIWLLITTFVKLPGPN